MSSVRLSVPLSVTLVDEDHIDWKSYKLFARAISPTSSLFVAQRSFTTYSRGTWRNFGEKMCVRSTPTSITSGWTESTESHVILGGGMAVCLLLSVHHAVIFAIAQLSCYLSRRILISCVRSYQHCCISPATDVKNPTSFFSLRCCNILCIINTQTCHSLRYYGHFLGERGLARCLAGFFPLSFPEQNRREQLVKYFTGRMRIQCAKPTSARTLGYKKGHDCANSV